MSILIDDQISLITHLCHVERHAQFHFSQFDSILSNIIKNQNHIQNKLQLTYLKLTQRI